MKNLLLLIFFIFIFLSLFFFSDLPALQSLSLSIFIFYLLEFINNIGKRFNIIEIIVPYALLTWLVMPIVAYNIFNEHFPLAKLWVTYMPIPQEQYFSYALPATILFIMGIRFPFFERTKIHSSHLYRIKNILKNKGNLSIIFIITGIIAFFLSAISPEIIANIVSNFSLLTFVGMFYAIYSGFKNKKLIVFICFVLMIFNVILTGMYGQLIYMSILTTLIVITGKKLNLLYKYSLLLIGVFGILFIQSIKNEYRKETWNKLERNADPVAFGNIILKKLTNPSELMSVDNFFNMANRANQGKLVASVIYYVPKYEKHANGKTIIDAVLASLVPRFLWPDKPRTGGADMVCKYLGDCASAKRGMSYNVAPLGEAYINFGVTGGAIFLFFYGFFLKFIYIKALNIATKHPTLILWLPLIFMGTVFTMENDILSALNTFTKSSIFVFIMFHSFRVFFKIKL